MATKTRKRTQKAPENVEVQTSTGRGVGRPKNVTLVHNGEVYSVTPANFRSILEGTLGGEEIQVLGKSLGPITADVTKLGKRRAKSLLNTLA